MWKLYDVHQRWWFPSNSYDHVWMYLILLYHYSSYTVTLMLSCKSLIRNMHTLDTMYKYNVIWPFKVTLILVWVFFIFYYLFILFYFFVSIASCCHVLLVFLWFLVPLVPSMLVFCLSPIKFFGFLCHLTIVSKRGRNLGFECQSSGEVIDLWGELHIKGKEIFLM